MKLKDLVQTDANTYPSNYPPQKLNAARGAPANPPNGKEIRIYLNGSNSDQIKELARITRLSLQQLTNSIFTEALSRIELIPTTLYDFKIK